MKKFIISYLFTEKNFRGEWKESVPKSTIIESVDQESALGFLVRIFGDEKPRDQTFAITGVYEFK